MKRWLILLACLALGHPAWAGAWLREEGTGFLSLSVLQNDTGKTEGALYAEYGLRERLTLGLKVDADMTAGRMGDGTVFVFAKRPIRTGERPFKLAYQLGVGSTYGGQSDTLLLTGLSYGRGFTLRDRSGWLAVDASAEWSLSDQTDTFKLDTTVGLTISPQFKVMMQVFLSQTDTETTATLAPSLIWQPKDSKRSYQFGVEAEEGSYALRLGLWSEF